MAKFDVTPELGEVIRITRIQNNIASKTLAAHLERSPAYISKLEKGEIRTIEESELTSILEYIVTDGDSFTEKLEAVTETLVQHYSREIVNRQLWLDNYDWVTRKVPVPAGLIEELRGTCDSSTANAALLANMICANVELPEALQNDKAFPCNQWKYWATDGNQYIKLQFQSMEIAHVLDGSAEEASYLLLFVIIRFLRWIELYGTVDELTSEQLIEISRYAGSKLSSYGIRTIVNQVWQRRDEVIQKNLSSMLSSQNPEMGSFAEEMLSLISILTRLDLPGGAQSLRCLNSSLEWDTAFTERIMRLPFSDLEGVSHTNKKRLLAEIEQLIQKYKDLPPAQKSLESYD